MPNNEWPDAVVEALARAVAECEPKMMIDWEYCKSIPNHPLVEIVYCQARAALSAIAPYIAQREADALERAATITDAFNHGAARHIGNAIRALKNPNTL